MSSMMSSVFQSSAPTNGPVSPSTVPLRRSRINAVILRHCRCRIRSVRTASFSVPCRASMCLASKRLPCMRSAMICSRALNGNTPGAGARRPKPGWRVARQLLGRVGWSVGMRGVSTWRIPVSLFSGSAALLKPLPVHQGISEPVRRVTICLELTLTASASTATVNTSASPNRTEPRPSAALSQLRMTRRRRQPG